MTGPGRRNRVVRFVHPMTGQAYKAAQTEDRRSIAVELLQLANRYWRQNGSQLDRPMNPTLRTRTLRDFTSVSTDSCRITSR